MSREAMQQALEALEGLADYRYTERVKNTMASLRAALAEPEQEPVAYLWQHSETGRLRVVTSDQIVTADATWFVVGPLYLGSAPAPRKPEHITDGSPCWCNPDVIEEEGGNVIVHNYEDNWQQYAKPGETAQQCIERHRAEQDALMKLYSTPRKPLTDEKIDELSRSMVRGDKSVNWLCRAIELAHGIKEQK